MLEVRGQDEAGLGEAWLSEAEQEERGSGVWDLREASEAQGADIGVPLLGGGCGVDGGRAGPRETGMVQGEEGATGEVAVIARVRGGGFNHHGRDSTCLDLLDLGEESRPAQGLHGAVDFGIYSTCQCPGKLANRER